jgi:hypothetical protein
VEEKVVELGARLQTSLKKSLGAACTVNEYAFIITIKSNKTCISICIIQLWFTNCSRNGKAKLSFMNWYVEEVYPGKINLTFIPFSYKAWFIVVDTCSQSNRYWCA